MIVEVILDESQSSDDSVRGRIRFTYERTYPKQRTHLTPTRTWVPKSSITSSEYISLDKDRLAEFPSKLITSELLMRIENQFDLTDSLEWQELKRRVL